MEKGCDYMAIDSRVYLARNKITLEDYNDLLIELEEYIKEFLEEKDIDKKHFTSMQWAACLMYLYRHTFRINPKYLFRTDRASKDIYNYDLFKVNKVLDIYLYLCYVYSFRICIDHFSFFTGINTDTINRWRYVSKTYYIDSDSDLCISRVGISSIDIDNIDNVDISNIDMSSNNNIYSNRDTYRDNIDSVNTSSVYSSSNNSSVNNSDIDNNYVSSDDINIGCANISSNVSTGLLDSVKVTIRPVDIYNRLISNTVSAADDLMLSKHGVNSIAYRNMISERFSTKTIESVPVLGVSDLAKQLGISKELASLPDKESE